MSSQSIQNRGSDSEAGQPSQGIRSVVTLVLFFHLFCAFALLVAGQIPTNRDDGALLAQKLARRMSAYGQLLNFDTSARFYLTQHTPDDENLRLESLPAGASPTDSAAWISLTTGTKGTLPYLRNQNLADTIAYF